MALKVVIADDEPIARDILKEYVSKNPELELVGECKNALEVFALLNKTAADLLLLDINMPEISGVELVKTLRNPPMVIFTTAYSEYAVESYELNAIDYLLKPIPYDRFVTAINKAIDYKEVDSPEGSVAKEAGVIFVKSEGKLVKVDLQDIMMIEGVKDYVKIHTTQAAHLVHSTMKHMEEQLSEYDWLLRTHKSYIVNLNHLQELEGNMLKLEGHTALVGATYKDRVQEFLAKYKLI